MKSESLSKPERFCLITLTLILFIFSSCVKKSEKVSPVSGFNHLKSEKSPYLLQHADNPVWWYSWGDEAFQEAKRQNKPIFLSVGYSTCHWCHVMEKESFTNAEVATALNRTFIAIKVDREERPDVDAVYMEAVQAMTGSGGWPMTVFLTPNGQPFFGGTYFPRDALLQILGKVDDFWKNDPLKIREDSDKLLKSLAAKKHLAVGRSLTNNIFVKFFQRFTEEFDSIHGGRLGQPKFPPAYALRLLLRIHRRTGNPDALKMVTKTLDAMGRGGIYDAVGGGFHRYSTDEKWLVPHFEKMLYDQAALMSAYLEAYQVTRNDEYRLVVQEIADYVLRDMTAPEGGFYSAEDADSDGVEGKFYVWNFKEIKSLLTPGELREFKKNFSISPEGNFEGNNILALNVGFSRLKRTAEVKSAFAKLFHARAKRVRPPRDDKVITSWNGLLISALARAGSVLGEKRYAEAAVKAADFILSHNRDKKGMLSRRWAKGESRYTAYLEDYSFLIDALIELFQATSEPKWIQGAESLQAIQNTLFLDSDNGGYFNTQLGDKLLIERKKVYEDNVTPSGNSITVLNLLRLSAITFNPEYSKTIDSLLKSIPEVVNSFPSEFPQLLMAVDYRLDQSKEIALVADRESEALTKFRAVLVEAFNPNKVLVVGIGVNPKIPILQGKHTIQGKPTAYVCLNRACKMPTTAIEKAVGLTKTFEPYQIK
jgi:uncharacterized protein YyaL (SSP411 family)